MLPPHPSSSPSCSFTCSHSIHVTCACARAQTAWADHADVLSKLYSGTGALKTDFTRTGKRTLAGKLQDGVRSVKRYFINNFADGHRQDGWDLFMAKYTPDVQDRRALRASARTETTVRVGHHKQPPAAIQTQPTPARRVIPRRVPFCVNSFCSSLPSWPLPPPLCPLAGRGEPRCRLAPALPWLSSSSSASCSSRRASALGSASSRDLTLCPSETCKEANYFNNNFTNLL